MPRKGRELELLVQKLEKMIWPENFKIESPGFIRNKITKRKREVDVLIEGLIGTTEIKIIIECRKRVSKPDSTWIEQLHTKAESLNVNKVIAVSSKPFAEEAKELAKHFGIETRIYSEIDTNLLESWLPSQNIELRKREHQIKSIGIGISGEEKLEKILKKKKNNTKFIWNLRNEGPFSFEDIFLSALSNPNLVIPLEPNKPATLTNLILNYPNPEERFVIRNGKKNIIIEKLYITAEFKLVLENIPASRTMRYGDEKKEIGEVIEFDNIILPESPTTLQFIKSSDGKFSISARKNNI